MLKSMPEWIMLNLSVLSISINPWPRMLPESFNTKSYSHHQYLFGKVDAVSVVVPTPAHFSVAKDFLENNIDVLIEKPMSETTEQADDLIGFAKDPGVLLSRLDILNDLIRRLWPCRILLKSRCSLSRID